MFTSWRNGDVEDSTRTVEGLSEGQVSQEAHHSHLKMLIVIPSAIFEKPRKPCDPGLLLVRSVKDVELLLHNGSQNVRNLIGVMNTQNTGNDSTRRRPRDDSW
ncbi:hypothetical protein WICPIJ_001906 [Wickerhamomyces pijperi]|uniref:Uncharacterized protein n=1 Tax=Wickerhamomyces pijperi TaxID=599730 RepID=A0A9P8TQB2_WICPI|nr:hypothetical protein WICPIJ_001906 [Wickerhamomyces pijperi]